MTHCLDAPNCSIVKKLKEQLEKAEEALKDCMLWEDDEPAAYTIGKKYFDEKEK
jgi:chaperonin cofactor prefoldin